MNERDELNLFEVFKVRFMSKWDAKESTGNFDLTKIQGLYYELEENGKKIAIYEGSRATPKAIFTADRAWIDDANLGSELQVMLKEFVPFLRNERSLLREKDWPEIAVLER